MAGDGAHSLAAALDQSRLEVLKMYECGLGDSGAQALARVIALTRISELHMGSSFDRRSLWWTSVWRANCIGCAVLYALDNNISAEGMRALAPALGQMSHLTLLELNRAFCSGFACLAPTFAQKLTLSCADWRGRRKSIW